MLEIAAAGPLRTAASLHVPNSTLAGINHVALANAKHLLAENSARLANAADIADSEREHHAQIARIISR